MQDKIITFGEIMLRLSPPGYLRFSQTSSFDVQYGGGEANVAAMLAQLGEEVEFVTRLPENLIGEACLQALKKSGVGTRFILLGGKRLGIYYIEMGSSIRGSQVIYDRNYSSFSSIQPGMIDWNDVFDGVSWFHWTGITPAVSESCAVVCEEALQFAYDKGITVSCDLNYREKLWKWGRKAEEVMPQLVKYCTVVIGNEEDSYKVFGIEAPDTDVNKGILSAEKYYYVCQELVSRFHNLKIIAITLRGSLSASHNTWSAVMWKQGDYFNGMQLDIEPIVDRVGGGDAFAGGLIFGLHHNMGPQTALNFAICASGLKHTIFGDFNQITKSEVEKLMLGDASGRVAR